MDTLKYVILFLISANIIRALWIFFKNKLGSKIFFLISGSLIAIDLIALFIFDIDVVMDFVLLMQLVVFLYEAQRGDFFKKPERDFYDLKIHETVYLIFYNAIFIPSYFIYILATFPERVSDNFRPESYIIVLFIITYIVFFNQKKQFKMSTLLGIKPNRNDKNIIRGDE